MTENIAQQNLKEPAQVDWDNYPGGGSGWMPPPPAQDAKGDSLVYQGVATSVVKTEADEDYLNYLLDPIKLVNAGAHTGQEVRFTRASVKPFTKLVNGDRVPVKGNPNKLANFLRACGLQAKPQTNSEYEASVTAAKGKTFSFVLDWEGYDKATGERVKGYENFPDDPERPGQKKAILKAGDTITERDNKGTITGTRTIRAEVIFANPRLRYFKDPAPRVTR